jgi:excisionase family DNA binding protein
MEPLNQIPESEPFEPRLGRSVSIEQAAQLLGVSRRTVYNRIRDGKLQTIRTLGGSQRVLLTSLDEMRRLTTMGHAAAPPLSRVEGPALRAVEGPPLSRVEGPPLSRVQSIVAGHPVPPIDSDRQVS